MAYCHKREGTWRFVLENESILYEFGPNRVPRQFDHKPTHQRRMLEAEAAVPKKMAVLLPVQLPPALPSVPALANADAAEVDGRGGAGEEKGEEAELVEDSANGIGAGARAGTCGAAHDAVPGEVPDELEAAFVRRTKAKVGEAVEKEARHEKQKVDAKASKRRAAGSVVDPGDAAAPAAAVRHPRDATASPSHLIVCALCRVRPRVPTSLPACIGYLTAQAGESCSRCNVTAGVYALLHKYRSFKLSEDDGNWFTEVRYGGLLTERIT